MKKLLTFAAVTAVSSLAAFSASADVVDFANYVDTEGETAIDSGDTLTIDGVEITFNSNFLPYFDGSESGDPGGLGVCRAADPVGSNGLRDCTDGSDDSIDGDENPAEYVELVFTDPYDLLGISFWDGSHDNLDNDFVQELYYSITYSGGVSSGVTTFGSLVDLVATGVFAGVTNLWVEYAGTDNATEFYIASISDIPIPGALPLLLSGIAGLGFATRRKKKAA